VDVERAGARRGFVIEPGPEGRLGIATQRRNQAVSVGAALQQALAIPGNAYSSALTGIGRATTERGELAGPVALVRASGDQTNSLATIQFLTFYGVWLWPWLAGIHLWDAVTLALFARTHGFALDPERPALLARFCRLYQALGITLVVSTACLVLAGFSQLPLVGAVVLLPLLLLYPCAISLYPLVWLAAKARWQQRSLWIVPAVFVALVPCSALLAGFVLHAWLRRELKAEGLAVSWFGAQPAPVIA
jgi:hypothetical protein